MSVIVWTGVRSDSCGIVVERYPDQSGPARRFEVLQIPGRNGDLYIDSGAFDNYMQNYEVYFNANKEKTPSGARAVRSWLQSPIGYQRLEDSYDPDFFRMAYYTGPSTIENVMNLFGRATISFNCKPQRWRKDGEVVSAFWEPGAIYNDLFPSLPLIKVVGSGAGILSVGGVTIRISEIDEYVVIDCDLQDAYKDTQNKNSTISLDSFPVLNHGENVIGWSGGIESIEITPRWWTV